MARQLCFIDKVNRILPIPGADRIEIATVRNWNTIIRKGTMEVGDKVLFFEPDTLIPKVYDYFSFLDEVDKCWLVSSKTMRNVKSQGLALPLSEAEEIFGFEIVDSQALGKILNLQIYDRYKGEFPEGSIGQRPSHIPSLHIERIQNISPLHEIYANVTLKYDGEQRTIWFENGVLRYASKNTLLDLNDDCESNRVLFAKPELILLAQDYYVICELAGPGIRGNRHNLKQKELVIIALFNYDGKRLDQDLVNAVCDDLELMHIDSFGWYRFSDDLEDIIKSASMFAGDYEGVVLVDKNGFSYKVILDELR